MAVVAVVVDVMVVVVLVVVVLVLVVLLNYCTHLRECNAASPLSCHSRARVSPCHK